MKLTAMALLVVVPCILLLGPAPPAQAAPDSFFDIFLEGPMAGPPYPTQPVITITGNWYGPEILATENVKMRIQDAHPAVGEPFGASCFAHDGGGGGGGGYQVESFFDVYFEATVQWPDPPPESFFDIYTEVTTDAVGGGGGGGACTLVPRHLEYPINDARRYFDATHVESFFDIFFSVDDGLGIQDYHLHGACPVTLSFFDVYLEVLTSAPDSFFDIFIEMARVGVPDPAVPMFTITTTGTFTPHPIPVQAATWSGVKNLYGH